MIPSRRVFLTSFTASAAGLLPISAAQTKPAASMPDDSIYVLTPQSEEGPFYLDPQLVRTDITEGRPGTPLDIRFQVVEVNPGNPVSGARVDVWHCDAQGLYSGYPDQGDHNVDNTGRTFLRGTQMTDSAGRVRFETIYPGWYAPRTTHVHFKVFLDQKNVLTGQMYFPDALSEYLYSKIHAYGGRKFERSVVNTNDFIAGGADPERRGFCSIKEESDRYVATLILGIDRTAAAANEPFSPPPAGAFFKAGSPLWGPRPMSLKDRLAAMYQDRVASLERDARRSMGRAAACVACKSLYKARFPASAGG